MAPLLGLVAGPLLDMAGKIFDRVIPDKAAAERAKLEFAAVAQSQEFQLALEQIKVNLEEAKHPSIYIAGWRPFIGWVCGFAFVYSYILLPFLLFVVYALGSAEMITQLGNTQMVRVLLHHITRWVNILFVTLLVMVLTI